MAESRDLLQHLQAFLEAPTWGASRRVVEEHPELIGEEAEALLRGIVEGARLMGQEEVVRLLEEHLNLLRRCREVGVERAFAEKMLPSFVPPELAADLLRAKESEARFLRTSDRTALDEAVEAWRRVLNHPAFLQAGRDFRLAAWNDAGGTYLRRYWARGELQDLNCALELWQRAVDLTPEGHPDLPGRLNNLAVGLSDLYARLGRLEDLEEGIEHGRRAVDLTPEGHPGLPTLLNSLANGLRERYARLGRLEDLEEGIEHWRRAVDLTPEGHPDLPGYLNNLAVGLRERYARLGRLEDLEEGIAAHRRAVDLTPEGHPDLPGYLNNLAVGLRERYARLGRLEDLEEGIAAHRRAVDLTPEGHPDLPGRLNNLANGLRERYARLGRLEDLEEQYRAYRRALETVEMVRRRQRRRAERQQYLEKHLLLYDRMVEVCLLLGREAEAWYWAEMAKGRGLLEQMSQERPRLDTEEKQRAWEVWERSSQEVFAWEQRLYGRNGHGWEGEGVRSLPAGVREEWEARLREARQREQEAWEGLMALLEPGEKELLQVEVPKPEELVGQLRELAGARRPLLVDYYFLADRYLVFLVPLWPKAGGVPVEVREGRWGEKERKVLETFAEALGLARLGFAGRYRGAVPEEAQGLEEAVKEVLRQKALQRFEVLAEEVGQFLVQPWEEALERYQPDMLLVAGHLETHLLPLHAALLRDGRWLMEVCPVVYLTHAALAGSLLRKRGQGEGEKPLVLGPPGTDLPGALREAEELAFRWFVDWEGQPYAQKRMKVQVLREWQRRANRVHAASHSRFNWEEPLDSGILFWEEMLRVRHLLSDPEIDLQGCRLFYLSSCESGMGRPTGLTDDLVGLVWAILHAGARAVLATLWPVDDGAALRMAEAFYRFWDEEHCSLAEAYRRAMEEMREGDREEVANPYFWAPFVLFGDGMQGEKA